MLTQYPPSAARQRHHHALTLMLSCMLSCLSAAAWGFDIPATPAPALKVKPRPAAPFAAPTVPAGPVGRLVIDVDAECELKVNGESRQVLKPDEAKTVTVAAGDQLLECISQADGRFKVKKVQTVEAGKQTVVSLALASQLQAERDRLMRVESERVKDEAYAKSMAAYERQMIPYNQVLQEYRSAKEKCDYAKSSGARRESCEGWASGFTYSSGGRNTWRDMVDSCMDNSRSSTPTECKSLPNRPTEPQKPKRD